MTWKEITVASVLMATLVAALPSHAEVNVNVNIGPPAVVVAEPPPMIPVRGTMVYFAPDVEADLFYYAGFWWTPHRGRWFRSRSYDGPWVIVAPRLVPVAVVRVPKDYRKVYAHGRRIPYGQLRKHYEERERERRERRGEWKERKQERREGHQERGRGRKR